MYEYNTSHSPIILREYGRNVQKIIDYIRTIEDKTLKTQYAHHILKLMDFLSPCEGSSARCIQKRWGDLFFMADYKLDIESSYPVVPRERLFNHKEPITYRKQSIKYRHYGRHVELLISKAMEMTDPEEQKQAFIGIVQLIKHLSATWHPDSLDHETILAAVKNIAGDKSAVDWSKMQVEHTGQHIPQERSRNHRSKHKRKSASSTRKSHERI